jgi:hypothetical protein
VHGWRLPRQGSTPISTSSTRHPARKPVSVTADRRSDHTRSGRVRWRACMPHRHR